MYKYMSVELNKESNTAKLDIVSDTINNLHEKKQKKNMALQDSNLLESNAVLVSK